MALQATYKLKTEIPEGLESHYAERDGAWHLDVEGVRSNDDYERMEAALKKRIDEAKALLSNRLTADTVKEIVAKALADQKPGDKNGDDKDKPEDGDAARRVAALEQETETLKKEKADAISSLQTRTIQSELVTAIAAAGARPQVSDSLAMIATGMVELDSKGEVRTKVDCAYGPDMAAADLVKKMKLDPAYQPFWPESKGGGAKPGEGGGGGDENPWKLASWDVLAQHKLRLSDQPKAERLAKEAGVSVVVTLDQARAAQKKAA